MKLRGSTAPSSSEVQSFESSSLSPELGNTRIDSVLGNALGKKEIHFPRSGILKSVLTFSVAICSLGVLGLSNPGPDSTSSVPVFLELFTSEGCSSCPPADAFIERMDNTQPVPGAHLIVLSEHVDYWDHLGWKDPYSSHAFTERQADYVRILHLDTAYTPQIILNGSSVLGGDAQQVERMLTQAASSARVPVTITSTTIESGSPPTLRTHIGVVATSLSHSADLLLALALDHAESEVLRGENGGKHLKYVAVAEEIKKVGKIERGKDFSQDVELKLNPGFEANNIRVVAFVQESGRGKILGAAEQRPKEN